MAPQVPQADVAELENELTLTDAAIGAGGVGGVRQKSITIGAVCKALAQEFPDISISKIRYLEDQKLLTPRRTPGGYRLYTQGDVARLRTILRLQRDEFLPLRVIRQELATGASESAEVVGGGAAESRRRWRPNVSVTDTNSYFPLEDVLEETKADPKLVAELEDERVRVEAS